MRDQLIAGNYILVNIAIEQAFIRSLDKIGLLCLYEKVYDRIHPEYL